MKLFKTIIAFFFKNKEANQANLGASVNTQDVGFVVVKDYNTHPVAPTAAPTVPVKALAAPVKAPITQTKETKEEYLLRHKKINEKINERKQALVIEAPVIEAPKPEPKIEPKPEYVSYFLTEEYREYELFRSTTVKRILRERELASEKFYREHDPNFTTLKSCLESGYSVPVFDRGTGSRGRWYLS